MAATASVFLNSKDILKSIAFYRGLGFKVAKEYKDDETGETTYADLTFQGADLGLGNAHWNDEPSFQEWVSTPLGAGVVVYFTVPNVDKVYTQAQASGALIEMPIADRPYGRMFTVNDPDGYTVSFLTEPKRRAVAKKAVKSAGKKAKKTVAKKASGAKKAAKKAAKKVSAKSTRRR